ncbi:MAG: hypothetical protein WDZ32_01165 [Candidatus Saccharimonadales bacterium]
MLVFLFVLAGNPASVFANETLSINSSVQPVENTDSLDDLFIDINEATAERLGIETGSGSYEYNKRESQYIRFKSTDGRNALLRVSVLGPEDIQHRKTRTSDDNYESLDAQITNSDWLLLVNVAQKDGEPIDSGFILGGTDVDEIENRTSLCEYKYELINDRLAIIENCATEEAAEWAYRQGVASSWVGGKWIYTEDSGNKQQFSMAGNNAGVRIVVRDPSEADVGSFIVTTSDGIRVSTDDPITINESEVAVEHWGGQEAIEEDDDSHRTEHGEGTVSREDLPGEEDNSGNVCQAEGFFGWLTCSAINFTEEVVNQIQNKVIIPFLQVSPLGDGASDPAYQVWNSFRSLANALLVLAFFVVIFSQSLSINLDTYTVKKMVPRLAAAAIFIQFSWWIVAILVDITNVLGAGIGAIVTAPLSKIGSDAIIQMGGLGGGIGSLGIAIGFGALISAGFTGAILLLLVPLLLAALGVLFTLVFRQILIIMLAALAPIAFVAWILPNTEKLFKMWWSYLLRALVMYPLIVMLFAFGHVVAYVASQSPQLADGVGDVIAVAAIIVPLLLVPATFKFAGGLISMSADLAKNARGRIMGGADGKSGVRGKVQPMAERRKTEGYQRGGWRGAAYAPGKTTGRLTGEALRQASGNRLGGASARSHAALFGEGVAKAEDELKRQKLDGMDASVMITEGKEGYERLFDRADGKPLEQERLSQTWNKAQHYSNIPVYKAAAAPKQGFMIDPDSTRESLKSTFGNSDRGATAWSAVAGEGKDKSPQLLTTDYQTGEIDYNSLLMMTQAKKPSEMTGYSDKAWKAINESIVRDGVSENNDRLVENVKQILDGPLPPDVGANAQQPMRDLVNDYNDRKGTISRDT